VAAWRSEGLRVALVPTMGALHEGHVALARLAGRRAERVVVSIFVNPTQFAAGEDLKRYPRDLAADRAKLSGAGAHLVFAPPVGAMYPSGFATSIHLGGPAAAGLEDRARPTHFAGVATVVCKLLVQCGPDVAVFGEKDWQQLQVVRHMTRDLDLPVRIVPAPTMREADGLALSSRNRFLTADERTLAPTLHRTLQACAADIRAGEPLGSVLSRGRAAIASAGFALDYMEARHAGTLAPTDGRDEGPARLLVAARIGRTRLIDNVALWPALGS